MAALLLSSTGVAHSTEVDSDPRSSDFSTNAMFNSPGSNVIVKRLVAMIRGAEEGSSIQIAEMCLWDESIMTPLEQAVDRGACASGRR